LQWLRDTSLVFDDSVLGVGPRGQVVAVIAVGLALATFGGMRMVTRGLSGAVWLAIGLAMIAVASLPGMEW
jgi:hypothetical protein